MSLFLNTLGLDSAAVAICDRCKTKVSITKLVSDPNSPGLRVCDDTCVDIFDPWRLPARTTENITLQYPRPEGTLEVPFYIQTEGEEILTTEAGDWLETEQTS